MIIDATLKVFNTFITIVLLAGLPNAQSQQINDSTKNKTQRSRPDYQLPYHRNVIKFNPTPMLLLDVRNITFSYERLLKNNNSFSIQLGYLVFPNLESDTIAGLIHFTSRERYGFNAAFDFRHYLFPRNTRPAPDGLYMGLYAINYNIHILNNFDILPIELDEKGTLEADLNFLNFGVELGYQFVFNKRWTVDFLLFGPAAGIYSGNFNLSGDLDEDQIAEIDEELIDKISDKFPLLNAIFSDETLQFTGKKTEFNVGFRYSISFGFHF